MSASCTRTHTHTAPTGTPQEGARRRATSRPAESPTRGRATLQVADRHTSETSMPRAHPRPQTGGHTGGERAHSRHVRISHACNSARCSASMLGTGRPNPRGTVCPPSSRVLRPRVRSCCTHERQLRERDVAASRRPTSARARRRAARSGAHGQHPASQKRCQLRPHTCREEDGEPAHEGRLVESARRLAAALVLQLAVKHRPARRSRGRAPHSQSQT